MVNKMWIPIALTMHMGFVVLVGVFINWAVRLLAFFVFKREQLRGGNGQTAELLEPLIVDEGNGPKVHKN